MDYVVKTGVFEGPFDLLLHLIARQQVDIWQVSLSSITEDYLAEIRRMRELNLEVATEFLVIAATLLELKAARLLPSPDGEPDEVESLLKRRARLFASLLQSLPSSRWPGCSVLEWLSSSPMCRARPVRMRRSSGSLPACSPVSGRRSWRGLRPPPSPRRRSPRSAPSTSPRSG